MSSSLDILIGSVNLRKLQGTQEVQLGDKRGVFIPFENNPSIRMNERGIYLNVTIRKKSIKAAALSEQTHTISAFVLNADYSKMTDEEKKATSPIIGNLKPAICVSSDPELTGNKTGGVEVIKKEDSIPL